MGVSGRKRYRQSEFCVTLCLRFVNTKGYDKFLKVSLLNKSWSRFIIKEKMFLDGYIMLQGNVACLEL